MKRLIDKIIGLNKAKQIIILDKLLSCKDVECLNPFNDDNNYKIVSYYNPRIDDYQYVNIGNDGYVYVNILRTSITNNLPYKKLKQYVISIFPSNDIFNYMEIYKFEITEDNNIKVVIKIL